MSIQDAKEFAKTAHKDQKYGDKDYFEFHLNGVADIACSINAPNSMGLCSNELLIQVALLHDCVEDHDVSLDYLNQRFGPVVVKAVLDLTKPKDESYYDYILKLTESGSVVSLIVKIADLTFNIRQTVSDISGCEDKSLKKSWKYKLDRYKFARLHIIKEGSKRFPWLQTVV